VGGVVVPSIISAVLEEAVKRIAKKVAKGKKLSDSEVMILILDQVNRRIETGFNNIDKRFEDIDKRFEDVNRRFEDLKAYVDRRFNDLKEYVDKRFDDMNRRFEDLRVYVDKRISELSANIRLLTKEVSSIKSDIIALMKEKLEEK